ncbi:hypothetical protein [Microbacter margulisiae]|uniref:Uncharacterized protein n=1 Tax=Microbacter margulisiae TaxID=1350067 RepID=A0A7W5DRI0_9PORP|nr:hypothetical protein [Microbacter margulisiae]MBB3187224.1 hypothetical protein [Microbacter margulisiae]
MILYEKDDKLKEAYRVSKLHLERMMSAYSKIAPCFPLTIERYDTMEPDLLAYFDQFVYRFSKLQDSMGGKLFKAILENLGEETRNVPFIDLLNKLEALTILDNATDWLILRDIRNIIAHEYPFHQQEVIEGLNQIHVNYSTLLHIWSTVESYLFKKFSYVMKEMDSMDS